MNPYKIQLFPSLIFGQNLKIPTRMWVMLCCVLQPIELEIFIYDFAQNFWNANSESILCYKVNPFMPRDLDNNSI